jgi:hypothetical protein
MVFGLIVTGIDHSRGTPERILPGFPVLSIHICGLRLRFLIWTLLSTVTTFQPHSASRRQPEGKWCPWASTNTRQIKGIEDLGARFRVSLAR